MVGAATSGRLRVIKYQYTALDERVDLSSEMIANEHVGLSQVQDVKERKTVVQLQSGILKYKYM